MWIRKQRFILSVLSSLGAVLQLVWGRGSVISSQWRRHVIIKKLLDFIFNIIPIFTYRWEFPRYYINLYRNLTGRQQRNIIFPLTSLPISLHFSIVIFTDHWHTDTSVLSLLQSPLDVSWQRLLPREILQLPALYRRFEEYNASFIRVKWCTKQADKKEVKKSDNTLLRKFDIFLSDYTTSDHENTGTSVFLLAFLFGLLFYPEDGGLRWVRSQKKVLKLLSPLRVPQIKQICRWVLITVYFRTDYRHKHEKSWKLQGNSLSFVGNIDYNISAASGAPISKCKRLG
jgi:hypothetical protein